MVGIFDGRRERLFAQHVLAGCQQRLSDLAVQVIGNHDADSVDIVGVRDGLPAALGTFEAIAISGVVSESVLTSAMATRRTGGASAPKTVWAVR
jgi:hypothetical protein